MNRELNYLILIVSVMVIVGCTVSRSMDVKATGNNIKTIYGDGDVDLGYKSNTTIGLLNAR